jgi:hypothetical protein
MRIFAAILLLLSLSGCIARAAYTVVTLPVRVLSAGVDAVTTSQAEADEKRGREARKADEARGKAEREAAKKAAKAAKAAKNQAR